MIDVHLAIIDGAPKAWIDQCVSSIFEAGKQAGYPVDVHLFQGTTGHIGQSRSRGYALGSHPYVTYVDYDDYLLPDAFRCMDAALSSHPDAVFCNEMTLQNGQLRQGRKRHHLSVYRRTLLDGFDYSKWPSCFDLAITNHVELFAKNVVDLDECNYVHRLYLSEGRKLRRANIAEQEILRG